ncbi:hypothetical protein F4810DRAFT_675383 [Camillea tinctor]|nr:hypothetical protein F4810DRAFT_675383 [Camillea tinctor]
MSSMQPGGFAPTNPFRTLGNPSRATTGITNTRPRSSLAKKTNMSTGGTPNPESPSGTSGRVHFSSTSTAHNLDGTTATVATNLPPSNSPAATASGEVPKTATAATQTSPTSETAAAAAATTSSSAPSPQPGPSSTGPPNNPPPVPPAPPGSASPPPPPGRPVPSPEPNQAAVPPANMGGPNIIIVSPSQVPFLWYNCPVMAPSHSPEQTNQMTTSFPQATQNPNAPIHLSASHFLTNPPPQVYMAQNAFFPQMATQSNIMTPNGHVYVVGAGTRGNSGPVVFYFM